MCLLPKYNSDNPYDDPNLECDDLIHPSRESTISGFDNLDATLLTLKAQEFLDLIKTEQVFVVEAKDIDSIHVFYLTEIGILHQVVGQVIATSSDNPQATQQIMGLQFVTKRYYNSKEDINLKISHNTSR